QFEALVPRDLEPCHLVAGGGIAARVVSSNAKLAKRATEITPQGLVSEQPDGPVLNLAAFALGPPQPASRTTPVLSVPGSAMDSGKTTAVAQLAHGLCELGMGVGYAKVTGTAAGGDPWLVLDAGASRAVDFTDCGYASTYRVAASELEAIALRLCAELDS